MARTRRVRLFVAAVVIAAALGTAAPASAITFGHVDNNDHPYVGGLVVDFNGTKFLICSGTQISATIFLTAGHCTDLLDSLAVDPADVYVTGIGFVVGYDVAGSAGTVRVCPLPKSQS